jgi:hypothetical protein
MIAGLKNRDDTTKEEHKRNKRIAAGSAAGLVSAPMSPLIFDVFLP